MNPKINVYYRDVFVYRLGILIIFIMLYRNSWLPGFYIIEGRENYLLFLFGLCVFSLYFDFELFERLVKTNMIGAGNNYLFLLSIGLFISIIPFNTQEISSIGSVLNLFSYLCYVVIYFFIVPHLFLKKMSFFTNFLKLFSKVGLISAVSGLIFLFLGFSPVLKYEGAVTSFIVHPNYISFLFTTTIIITLYLFLSSKNVYKKVFYLSSFFIQLIAQLFTFSRAGLIGTGVGILIILLLYFRVKFFILIPLLVILSLNFILSFFKAKGFGSFISRLYLLIPAYHMIIDNRDRLLWGYGISNSFKIYEKFKEMYGVYEKVDNPHNSFATLMLMFGIVFVTCALLFFFSMLVKGIKTSLKATTFENKMLFGFLVSICLGLIFHGLFDSGLFFPNYFDFQFFLIFLGCLRLLNQNSFILHNKISFSNVQ